MRLTDEQAQAYRSPFDALVGVRLDEASHDRVRARLPVRDELLQPGGIVHGGVYATLVETVASIGANLWIGERASAGRAHGPTQAAASGSAGFAVGVSNHTDFLRATAGGDLVAVATPLQRGRTLQLWQVEVTDGDGRVVAHGKVRLANRSPAASAPPDGAPSPRG